MEDLSKQSNFPEELMGIIMQKGANDDKRKEEVRMKESERLEKEKKKPSKKKKEKRKREKLERLNNELSTKVKLLQCKLDYSSELMSEKERRIEAETTLKVLCSLVNNQGIAKFPTNLSLLGEYLETADE